MKEPGFLRCIVSTDVAGHRYRGLATAAFAPEKITATQTEPADFDAFWAAAKAELAKVPMEAMMTLLPDSCTSTVDVYHVSFRVGRDGQRSRASTGSSASPRRRAATRPSSRCPARACSPYFGDPDLAAKGAIVLEIGIHGIPVNLAKEVYDELGAGALNGYWLFNFDDRDNYYYQRIYLGCIRANDFLTSRPAWDGKNLLVMGASQGGQLTIVTAALDHRVTGLSATHPAFCDVSARAQGPRGRLAPSLQGRGGRLRRSRPRRRRSRRLTYYDTVNFAKRLRVPGYYNWGYNDETCPPTAAYAAYNVITAPKTLGVTLELGHSYTKEQADAITGWVTNFLGFK